jgi:hypothetical protein
MKKVSLSILKITLFLFTAIFFIGHNYAQAEEKPVVERLVTINLEDQDFNQALMNIADQSGITINIHGQIPAGKRDISITNMSLNEAMGHILRIYGVRNHAAAYNPEKKTVMLAILETSTLVAALSPQLQTRLDDCGGDILTSNQMEEIKKKSSLILAEMEESSLPITPYQIEHLREKSLNIESDMDPSSQLLNEEQLQLLREKNAEETEMDPSSQLLNDEQLQLLREKNAEETEMDPSSQLLNDEQLQLLRKNNTEI